MTVRRPPAEEGEAVPQAEADVHPPQLATVFPAGCQTGTGIKESMPVCHRSLLERFRTAQRGLSADRACARSAASTTF